MAAAKPKKPLPMVRPDEPAPYDDADVFAVQALFNGRASEEQQKRAFNWIVEQACKVRDLPWVAGGLEAQRATDFSCGRKYAGHQVLKMLELRPGAGKAG